MNYTASFKETRFQRAPLHVGHSFSETIQPQLSFWPQSQAFTKTSFMPVNHGTPASLKWQAMVIKEVLLLQGVLLHGGHSELRNKFYGICSSNLMRTFTSITTVSRQANKWYTFLSITTVSRQANKWYIFGPIPKNTDSNAVESIAPWQSQCMTKSRPKCSTISMTNVISII